MILGLHHLNERHLTLRHLKIILAVYLAFRAYNKTWPTASMIGVITRLDVCEFDAEVRELVELRYLHEEVPIYGSGSVCYRLGSMGGTLMRHILKDKPLDAPIDRPQTETKSRRGRPRQGAKGHPEGQHNPAA